MAPGERTVKFPGVRKISDLRASCARMERLSIVFQHFWAAFRAWIFMPVSDLSFGRRSIMAIASDSIRIGFLSVQTLFYVPDKIAVRRVRRDST
jgi:hypothetical protein